ncbi:UvrD-helicase domain-containing protein [Tenacibaculum sp. MEBiC07804]|uniref:UvrD-helicase domain-containing protein n=1 Tax=Tenacibaculum sp. MEBiC07804 TaxID=3412025 RepID=UPI003BAB3D11
MQVSPSFQIFNASAGSGKTFTLVKEYLKVVLQSSDVFYFQKILAITFTNKAAGEMKERVMKSLSDAAEEVENDIIGQILQETTLDKATVKERSTKILDAILQNYSAFSITTIDSFTHKIIKNFAHDLGLTLNFEVEMDAVSLLNEAVDILISKIGTNKELTNLLIDFSLSKIDEDKSWDISYELKEFSKILLNENDVQHFRNLADKSINDFFSLKEKLVKANNQIESLFTEVADKALLLVKNNGLEFSDFSYSGEVPKHFEKLLRLKFLKDGDLKFDGRINKNFELDKNLFAGKASAEAKSTIEDLYDDFKELYYESKRLYEEYYGTYLLNNLVLKSLIPLAVLNSINSELQHLKEENNIRLNAEFNQLISDNIKNQPTPFIYERLGQRFMNYFIDEMQDTSVLQWENLIPLIDNALAQENSSLLLVGDAKQAIYRWRGGKAEQFINLSNENHKIFQVNKSINLLDTNYRSFSEVVNFNNQFFQHVSSFLNNEDYKQLFVDGNKQLNNSKKGGYVSLSFLEKQEDKSVEEEKYPKKVFEKITELKQQYSLNEIAVLVRKKSEGIQVANYLSEKGIPIISSETLLLKNNERVNFIANIIQLILQFDNEEKKFEILYFLHKHLTIDKDAHSFYDVFIKTDINTFFNELQSFSVDFNLNIYFELPFYDKIEYIIRSFNLLLSSDAYVQFFLDVVLDQQNKGNDVNDFIEFWNVKKEVLSIVTSEDADAVHIMTIHKSKGLEFPVVIFPYDLDIYRQVKPKVWFDGLPETFDGFKSLFIDFNKSLANINSRGTEMYNQQIQELELDNLNLLYVALTRAVEQLHIITEKKIGKSGENTNYYSGIFISFLKNVGLWLDTENEYHFGESLRFSEKLIQQRQVQIQEKFITTAWQRHNIVLLASASKLWDTNQEKSIQYGNLVHAILSEIYIKSDIERVFHFYTMQGDLSTELLSSIKSLIVNVVDHPLLKDYFSNEVIAFNEKEILTVNNDIIIPDRLVFSNKNVTIIDYKTGVESVTHVNQLEQYADELESLEFKIIKKILVYINDEVLVKEID